jgi:SSS family solute:Na+ symporter
MTPEGTSNLDVLVPLLIDPAGGAVVERVVPGFAEPGGGGYVAQRMLSAKDEKNAVGATLFFNAAHYALRPWPWILVALCSLVVFPMDSPADAREAAKANSSSRAPLSSCSGWTLLPASLEPDDEQ